MRVARDAAQSVVCLGGSAGSVAGLELLVVDFPVTLPAAVLVAIHLSPHVETLLHRVLGYRTALPTKLADDGEPLRRGHIYVARPDRHLVIDGGVLRLGDGPHENRSRPAIDPLFRSAAAHFSAAVTAAVLSGNLDDGAAGVVAVKQADGTVVVQDPEDAECPSMPRAALAAIDADHVVPITEMGSLLARLAGVAPGPDPSCARPTDQEEARIAMGSRGSFEHVNDSLGTRSALGCPSCLGPLWEIRDGRLIRYRCNVGHSYSPQSLIAEQDDHVLSALEVAARLLEDRAASLERLAAISREHGRALGATAAARQAEHTNGHADRLRALLRALRLSRLEEPPPTS